MLQRKTSQLSFPLQAADRFTKRHEKSVIYLLTYLPVFVNEMMTVWLLAYQ